MTAVKIRAVFPGLVCVVSAMLLTGCNSTQTTASIKRDAAKTTSAPIAKSSRQVYSYTVADRDCLKRAMYFESRRSSKNGFMAVGSVVMNRLTSADYPDTICEVVAQEKQFAPGVMTRAMKEETAPELNEAADAILRGERHPQVKDAMFFHTEGLKFPYRNMHYVTVAGGNAFYEKRGRDGELQTEPPKAAGEYMLSFVQNPIAGSIPPGLAMAAAITTAPTAATEAVTTLAATPAAPSELAVNSAPETAPEAAVAAALPVPAQATDLSSAHEVPMLSMMAIPVPMPRPRSTGSTQMVMAAPSPADWPLRPAARQ